MEQKKIDRINELAHKAKAEGLTDAETAERDTLRSEYLADVRKNFKSQVDNTYVLTEDGAKIPYAEYLEQKRQADAAKEQPEQAPQPE